MGRHRETRNLEFVIVTGLSGAGKTRVMNCFEDFGFFCIDNLPPQLLPAFTHLLLKTSQAVRRVALGIDIRGGEFFEELISIFLYLDKQKISYQILFLEADPKVIVARYKEARRRHPLAKGRSVLKAIEQETKMLSDVKERAHQILDTSHLTVWDLKRKVSALFLRDKQDSIALHLISFGFKYGIPLDADLVMDVRFLPNPNYEKSLSHLTGKDKAARAYVMRGSITREFIKHFFSLLKFLVPWNIREGKGSMVIAIGCTGGKHRSVVVVDELQKKLRKKFKVSVLHRDIARQ